MVQAMVFVPEGGLRLVYRAPVGPTFRVGRLRMVGDSTPLREPPPAAWQPDPSGRNDQRYWDGQAWTGHVMRAGQPGWDPA
jgi:hypothetical protein